MKFKRSTVAVLTVYYLYMTLSCGGSKVATQPATSDPMRQIAVQIDRAALGLDSAIDVKRALLRDGLITQAQSAALTPKILTAIRLVRELKDTLATVNDFQTGKPELSAVFARVQSGFSALSDLGVIPAGAARSKIDAALKVAVQALASLQPLLGRS